MADDELKIPLGWKQRRTPKRGTKRSRNWRRIYPGYRFPNATWVVTFGPWRKIKRTGSISYVTARCAEEHGGCDQQFDRVLDTLVSGRSRQCIQCHHRRQREAAAARRAEAGTEPELAPDSSSD